MLTWVLLAGFCLQQDALLDELRTADSDHVEAVQAKLVAKGREIYPAIRKAMEAGSADFRSRARVVAYGLGIDPDSHRTWETLWVEYRLEPSQIRRKGLLALARNIRVPKLTLLQKVDQGLFRHDPMRGDEEDLKQVVAPTAKEWDVADEVIQACAKDPDPAWVTVVDSVRATFSDDERALTLYHWGVSLLKRGAPRENAIGAFRCALRLSPKATHRAQIRDYVDGLDQVLREDETVRFETPLAKMNPAEQADYWIYQLRNSTRLLADGGEPSRKLLDLGRSAIPSLIAVLVDKRLTRCVAHSPENHEYFVVTYHGAAEEILEEITGLDMRDRKPAWSPASLTPEKRLAWVYKEWWETARTQQAVEWWQEWVESDGLHRRVRAARRLVKAEGDKAVASILKGLNRATGMDKALMVKLLGKLKGEGILPGLERMLADDKTERPVLRALAEAMGKHGDVRGLEKLQKTSNLASGELFELMGDFEVLVESGKLEFRDFVSGVIDDARAGYAAKAAATEILKSH